MKHSNYKPKFSIKPENVHSSIGKYLIADGLKLVLNNEASKPYSIVDAKTGKEYLDYFTSFASMPLGFNHPKLLEENFLQYLAVNSVNKPSNSDLYSEVKAVFANTLFNIAVPEGDFKYTFFIEGGALAVENALKTAFDWKVKKNFKKGYSYEKGHKIIHFKDAFHGRSGYTMSLTNTDKNKTDHFPQFDWPRIINPYITFPLENNLDKVKELEEKAINDIKKVFNDNQDDVAAIIIEPIQGEGGDNHFREEFLLELRKLADENDALLIYDEIQTGVGLTGTMWAYQQLAAMPDILCFGKKMQVCGILANERVDEVEDNVFHKSGRINSTWGGNYTDMVRATKYLEIIEEENLVKNASEMGKYLLSKTENLQKANPDIISNVRGRGLFAAFDIKKEKRKEFISKAYEEGLIILPCGQNSIRFRTPLSINKDQIDKGFEILRNALNEIG